MKTFCVDISSSMTNLQFKKAVDTVVNEYLVGDDIIIFDRTQAERITFTRIFDFVFDSNCSILRLALFKKGASCRWSGNGSIRAISMAMYESEKICITDGFLIPGDLKKFNRCIFVQNLEQ